MADLINVGMNALSGGLFGILGTAMGRVASYFERKQTFAQDQARWEHELKLHDLQQKARLQESEIELSITREHGSWKGLEASIQAEGAIGQASLWVINILRLVRPFITIILWLITAWIFKVTQDAAIVEAAVFAAVAATLWWFGDRAPKPDKFNFDRSSL